MTSPVQIGGSARGAKAAALTHPLSVVMLALVAGCGRLGVELLTFADADNICTLNVCSDDVDRCPADPVKTKPAICGCGVSDTADQDSDGTPDCDDMCMDAPDRLGSGRCGCAAASEDVDGDGVMNCRDLCPHDASKQAPRVCGCGVAEGDRDGDSMPDCADQCPDDANKVVPGSCGCGVVESTRDNDNDGKLDCVDLCNGIDDARYVPDRGCGVGYCQQHNAPSSCQSAVETDCRPGAPLNSSDATCDGIDDDCDGRVDDDFPSYSTTCGAGACSTQGAMTCVNGRQVDTCAPRTPAADDASCDGVNDDCDATVDEDFAPRASTCGAGVCTASGTVTCVGGATADSCSPGMPTLAVDTTCNAVDENCNGTNDEGYVQTPTSCGAGACASTGAMTCVGGVETNTCRAGTMAANDATCDGVDDDCDGTRDEDYVPVASMCGVGACRRSGTITCVGGAPSNSCVAGAPAANDASCNNIDDDCNGSVDEDYVPTVSNCGVGVCARSGAITCVGGAPSNSCVAGAPASSMDGPPANGLDDDCDGSIDEDACTDTTPKVYAAGTYTNITVPAGCIVANVRLWGGGGGSGDETSVGNTGNPGRGGSGGYAASAVSITGALNLYVGGGGSGCGAGGTTSSGTTYNGGDGAPGGISGGNRPGANGGDGVVAGGGAGATAGSGNGGRGYYGGGGGGTGASAPWPPYPGGGGGGGAASILLIGTTRVVVAGGGGGGGGTNGSSVTSTGGAGGEGCSGPGGAGDAAGGGGGGVCTGTTTARGSNGTPVNASSIPAGRANGGTGVCGGGGAGYAIIQFSR